MKTVLVTGGAGTIGSNIVKKLITRKYKVIVLDDLSAYPFDYLKEYGVGSMKNVEFVQGSILDTTLLNIVIRKADAVIHAAAYADVGACIRNFDIDFNVNVLGTELVLAAAKAKRVEKLVFVSSASVYGENSNLVFSEGDPTVPISTYGNSKLWGERQTMLFNRLYGLPTTAVRYFSVYGSPQVPKKKSHSWCVAIFAMRIMKQKPIILFGDGTQIRDFIHVSDVAHATVLALEKKETTGQVFNIGTGSPISIKEIAEKVMTRLGETSIEYKPHPSGDPKGGYADTKLMKALLGWEPTITLNEGIQEYCEWIKNHKHLIPKWL